MTREEATELLKQYNLYSPTKQIEEAIDMAIEALQADAVMRDATAEERASVRRYIDSISTEAVSVVRCKDCRHGEHIQIPLWKNRDIDKAPSQFHDFIKCHKFHIKGFNETLFLGDDDYCSYGERREKRAEQTEYKLPGHDEVMGALDKMKLEFTINGKERIKRIGGDND